MATELQNKIKYNGEEFEFAKTLPAPIENSDKPVASSYIFNLVRQLSGFLGKSVTNAIEANNNNIPTSAVIHDVLGVTIQTYPLTNHIMALYQQNVLFDFTDEPVYPEAYTKQNATQILPHEGARTDTSQTHNQEYYAKYRAIKGSTYLCRAWPDGHSGGFVKVSHGAAQGKYWKTYCAFHLTDPDNSDKLIARPFEPLHNKEIYLLVKCLTDTNDTHLDYVYGRTSGSSDASTYHWTYYGITVTGYVLAYWDADKAGDDKFVTIAEYPALSSNSSNYVQTYYDTVNQRLVYWDANTSNYVEIMDLSSE